MRVLVTGANGYLGQGIVNKLLDNGHEVIAADFKLDHVDNRANRMAGDIFLIENPFQVLGCPEVLLHLAWRDGFVHNSDVHITDLHKHYLFFKNMLASGLKRVACMGSMHEVGFFEGKVMDDTPCNPMNLYGISKDALRKATQLLASQFGAQFQWLRAFYIVSNSRYGSSIFSKISDAAASGIYEFPFTLGQNQYDFLDYNDFCIQVTATVSQREIDGIINIASGKPEKLADRVERFIIDNGYNIKLLYGMFPDRLYDTQAIWGDINKIQTILAKGNLNAYKSS
jgi:nucleoside-diphosphate-sugar epimerase